MIPNTQQLDEIALMREGDLAKIPFAALLHALAVKKRTAVLEIDRKSLKKKIVLENGVPVDCTSNLLHETLLQFMIDRGYLNEEKGQQCLHERVELGVQIGEVLIREGVVSASELYKLLQQNLATKLLDGFTWRDGHFHILDQQAVVESPLKVNVPQLVVLGVARFALQDEVNAAIGPLVGSRLFLHPEPPHPVADIRFSAHQQQLIKLLENGKRIDELAAETTIPFDEIMRLTYSLAVIGIVVTEERLPKTPKKAPAAPLARPAVPEPKAPQVAAPPTVDVEKRRNEIMGAYLKHRKQDAFELLGLEDGATPVEIEQKFLDYSRRFAPWTLLGTDLAGLEEKAEDLFLAGGRAFGELIDAESRRALLTLRRRKQEEQQKKPDPDRFAIRTELLDSKLQFKKGKALIEAGRYREALRQLQFAHDFEPQNTTYRAELAFCRFLEAPTREGESSLKELAETLRIEPKLGLGHYYAGQIHAELGRLAEAEGHLQKAIKLMSPDRRPIVAMKELHAKKKKRFF